MFSEIPTLFGADYSLNKDLFSEEFPRVGIWIQVFHFYLWKDLRVHQVFIEHLFLCHTVC